MEGATFCEVSPSTLCNFKFESSIDLSVVWATNLKKVISKNKHLKNQHFVNLAPQLYGIKNLKTVQIWATNFLKKV